MNNIPYIDILILAMIAIFIVNRLKNVLGKKTGNESDIVEKFSQKKAAFKESEPDKTETTQNNENKKQASRPLHSDKKINDSINQIITISPGFDLDSFIEGAKKAFEFILTKYSKNDAKSLNRLVSEEIFSAFNNQIVERKKNSETLEITVISVKDPEIQSIKIEKKNKALICLRFDSEQVQLTKNIKGEVIDGDNNQILSIRENWTFSKNLKNNDPNWTLEKIEECKK